jgi:hypothetical protein
MSECLAVAYFRADGYIHLLRISIGEGVLLHTIQLRTFKVELVKHYWGCSIEPFQVSKHWCCLYNK